MVRVGSQAGAVGCVPLRGKGQIKLATLEVVVFTQGLGYHSACFYTNNEPAVRKILRALLKARHALGLPTRFTTAKPYGHNAEKFHRARFREVSHEDLGDIGSPMVVLSEAL